MAEQPDPARNPTLTAFDLAHQAIQAGREVRWRVNGTSMRPLLRSGDVVIIRSVPLKCLRRGDIVMIRRTQDVVTHRLVGRDAHGWRTRGDGLFWFDPPFPDEAIMGKAAARERGGKRLDLEAFPLRAAGQCLAWLAWLVVPVLAFVKGRRA